MSTNGISPNGNLDINDFYRVPNEKLTDAEKNSLKVTQLSELQTNISKEIGTNWLTRTFNKIFHHGRTVALKNLNEKLISGVTPEQVWLTDALPKKTQELFRNYLSLFAEPEIKEDFKSSLTKEEFQQIWDSKQSQPIGEGGFGTVYQSADGKYALKVAKEGKSIVDDTVKNEALKNNTKAFDDQFYYKENDGFITKYVGTFKTEDNIDVAVFEKIEGQDFSKVDATTPALQCRLLAQAATAIAISHEAGCINSDIKPENMMVSTDPLILKLIDQGGVVDLTKGVTRSDIGTPGYEAPESAHPAPASDVFSLGVTILEKLSKDNPTIATLAAKTMLAFQKEALGLSFDGKYSRRSVSQGIAVVFQKGQLFGTPEESRFVGYLLRDCLAYRPEDRISAAQAAEILQVFSSYLENPVEECPNYDTVKAIAIEDCPKGIPIALRKMLFDPKTQSQALKAIKNLVNVDPSYKSTPSYGMILLLKSPGKFASWAGKNPEAAQDLKKRSYVLGSAHNPDQDMPVSEETYRKIQSLS